VNKTYACPATADQPTKALPSSAQGKSKHQVLVKAAPVKSKSCPPKILLLQNATLIKPATLAWTGSYLLTVPGDEAASEKPSLDPKQSQTVNQHDLVWRTFTGKALSGIGAVTISEVPLQINPDKDGKSISVLIPKWATRDSAAVDLTFLDKQKGQVGTAQILVKANTPGGAK
jgi:hypothetical protein